MTESPSQGRRPLGRPRVPLLTMDRIVDEALAIVTQHGIDGLTMARLARHLGVTPAALYNHAASKTEILLAVQDRLMEQVDVSGFGTLPWPDALRRWARSYRAIMAAQPGLVHAIALMPIRGAAMTTRMYEQVASALAAEGWRQRSIVPAIVALESFVFGSAYDAVAPADIFDLDDPDEAPTFAAAHLAHVAGRGPGEAADVAFEVGLDALLRSLGEWAGVAWPPDSPRRSPASLE